MSTIVEPTIRIWTAVDLAERFGAIPMNRIVAEPPPGSATEADAIRVNETEDRIVELVDGVLVEKPMGAYESYLAAVLIGLLQPFVFERRLGAVFAPDGLTRLLPDRLRVPDVSFVSIAQLPDGEVPDTPILEIVPEFAIEIISRSNTQREMDEKRREYFAAGVQLVWYVHPRKREVHVYETVDDCLVKQDDDVLDGGEVLPGFVLPLPELFRKLKATGDDGGRS